MSSEHQTRTERIRNKSARRREVQREALRQHILDAASNLFLSQGYENFSLRQVAEAVGYSATTIYLHFADKDALLFAVVLQGFEEFGQALQAAYDSAEETSARIEAIGRSYIRFGLEHPTYYRLMFMQRPEFLSRPHPEEQTPTIDAFGVLFKAVEEGLARGDFTPADPQTLAHLLWSGVHGIVALAISVQDCDAIQAWRVAELYFPTIISALSPSPV